MVLRLAEAPSPSAMRAIAVEISKPGLTARASREPDFERALRRLLDWVRCGEAHERLEALTVLARLRKQQNRAFPAAFEAALGEEIAPLAAEPNTLDDPKERDYLAQAMDLVSFPGQSEYLAKFVAGEGQTRTEARDTATLILLRRSASLGAAFDELAQALQIQSHDTQDPATSKARRLQRVLEALIGGLREVDSAVTQETGDAYARFLKASLSADVERGVAIEATNTALALLLAWVRPNFSVALVPETFQSIHDLRRLFLPARWPDETQGTRIAVGRLLREAIAFLARVGVADDKLRASLTLVLDEPAARGILRGLAKETPGLSNPIRHWLETGRAVAAGTESAAVSESVIETLDRDLAEAYRDSHAAMQGLTSLAGEVEEALEMSNPSLIGGFRDVVARLGRLTRRIEAIAAKRGFELQGDVGAAVEYSPADHVADLPVAGSRVVRLVSPMVIRRSAGGAPRLILQGKVEEA